MIKTIIICLALVYGGIIDFKKREIPDIVPIVIAVCTLLLGFNAVSSMVCLIITALILTLAWAINRGQTGSSAGGGDIKLTLAMGFAAEPFRLAAAFAFLLLILGIERLAEGKALEKSIPLCTYLAPSYILASLALWGVMLM